MFEDTIEVLKNRIDNLNCAITFNQDEVDEKLKEIKELYKAISILQKESK